MRRNRRGRSSQRTTLAHWFSSMRQVAVALDPLGEEAVDHGLARGPHDERLLELLAAAVGDDGQLGREALDVLGLELEEGLRDEQREVRVLGAGLFDAAIELGLHQLPDAVAPGSDDHGASGGAVVRHLGAGDDLLVPTREVLFARDDGAGASACLAHRTRLAVG